MIDEILLKPNSVELFAVLNPSRELKIFKNADKLICVYDRKDILDSGRILNEFIQFLNIPKVSTISVISKSQYKTENLREIEENIALLRGLNSEMKQTVELQSPNFIVGLCGGGNFGERNFLYIYIYHFQLFHGDNQIIWKLIHMLHT